MNIKLEDETHKFSEGDPCPDCEFGTMTSWNYGVAKDTETFHCDTCGVVYTNEPEKIIEKSRINQEKRS